MQHAAYIVQKLGTWILPYHERLATTSSIYRWLVTNKEFFLYGILLSFLWRYPVITFFAFCLGVYSEKSMKEKGTQ